MTLPVNPLTRRQALNRGSALVATPVPILPRFARAAEFT